MKFSIYLTALLCSMVNSQAQTFAPPPVPAGTLPSLVVGEAQLVFPDGINPSKLDELVAETHRQSLELRVRNLAGEVAKSPAKLGGPWLFNWWVSGLHQKHRLEEANEFMRKNASGAMAAYVYLMFGEKGRFPGRLEAKTEVVLKENMWKDVCSWLDPTGKWQLAQAKYCGGKFELLPLDWGRPWGNENHEVRYKPQVYLALSVLRQEAGYVHKSVGGKTVEEWFQLMAPHLRQLIKDRVMMGLWIEPGSHYQKHTYDNMVWLLELAPEAEIRQLAKMFLDLIFIEEAQTSVSGVRGGARSRGSITEQKIKDINSMVYGEACDGFTFFALSDYQAPAIAIVLRKAKGPASPYHIINRVPGEAAAPMGNYLRNSRLVGYAYRTPSYLLGCSLKNPNLTYHRASDQQRWSGVVFQTGEYAYPWPKEIPKKADSGRSGNAYWSIQQDGVMLLQKLRDSDSVEIMQAHFSPELKLTERDGWIFAEAGNGYLAVCFIDPEAPSHVGKYELFRTSPSPKRPASQIAQPIRDFLPMVYHAGDAAQYGSFAKFQETILAGKIVINADASELEYKPVGGPVITWNYNQDANPLVLPRVDGKTPDLQPALLFDSPFLKAKWQEPKIYAGAGPFRAVYDMEKRTVTESKK